MPDCNNGYFIQPTIFSGLSKDHPIANEEVFGPVLAIMLYMTQEEAVEIANATQYGLSAYIYAKDDDLVKGIAQQMRCGMVHINGAPLVVEAPFGGYKQSGNGREWGLLGLHEFIEVKAVMTCPKVEAKNKLTTCKIFKNESRATRSER